MIYLDWLRRALRDATESELLAELAAGRAELWLGEACAVVTQHVPDPKEPCLHIWLAGGRLTDVLALRPGIEARARGLGCRCITIDGRRGWRRVMRPFGYRLVGKELKRML